MEGKGVSAYQDRMLLDDVVQPGVVNPGDLKVTPTGAGRTVSVALGTGYVQGTQGVLQGMYRAYNDAAVALTHVAAVTYPRVDLVVLRIYDSTYNAGAGGSYGILEIVRGTEQNGVTHATAVLPAIPDNCLLLAVVLVGIGAYTIVSADIRDRRPWARGLYFWYQRRTGDYTISSTTYAPIDLTNMAPRVECSGSPLEITLRGMLSTASVGGNGNLGITIVKDAAAFVSDPSTEAGHLGIHDAYVTLGIGKSFNLTWDWTPPAPGSYQFMPYWQAVAGGITQTLYGSLTPTFVGIVPATYIIRETARQSASNL